MIEPKVGFIVYGVHKDGLQDPMGQPFIDEAIVQRSKEVLTRAGLKLVTSRSSHREQRRSHQGLAPHEA